MLPSRPTRKLHLKVVGNTKKSEEGVHKRIKRWGPGWSIISLIISREIILKCTQKEPKQSISCGGLTAPLKPPAADVGSLRSPHILIILYAWILRYTTIKTRSYFVRTPK